jgi:hypothetical protein
MGGIQAFYSGIYGEDIECMNGGSAQVPRCLFHYYCYW